MSTNLRPTRLGDLSLGRNDDGCLRCGSVVTDEVTVTEVIGNLTGDVTGDVTGNVTGGDITADTLVTGDLQLSNTSWDDLKFPAQSTKALAGKEPGVDADTGLFLFDKNGEEGVSALAQMPHAWAAGTTVKPHIHWMKTTSAAGDVFWQLQYKIAPIAEVMDASWTVLSSVTVATGTPDTDTANMHLITGLGDIDMTGMGLSDCIVMKIYRQGGEATDTYGADALLLEFDLHFEIDSLGSDEEYSEG